MVYLVQTDTTVGFLSSDQKELHAIKARSSSQKFLCSLSSFKELKHRVRVPTHHKNRVRRLTKTSFIYKNLDSYRVVTSGEHHTFLKNNGAMYSTSANAQGKSFDQHYCEMKVDVICETQNGFHEHSSSSLLILHKRKYKKLR